jgi:hypothetical protein
MEPPVSLQDWLRNGWLTEHTSSRREITDLLNMADRDLADCQTPGLSNDWRLSIAYNAGLQVATAALAASGYRVTREAHHYRVIQSLALTIGAERTIIDQLDQFRKKRNISDYDRAGTVSDLEVKEMTALAQDLRRSVERWLGDHHPEFLPE